MTRIHAYTYDTANRLIEVDVVRSFVGSLASVSVEKTPMVNPPLVIVVPGFGFLGSDIPILQA